MFQFFLSLPGVHAVLKRGTGISYALFNLANGRPEPGGQFPAETASFLSKASTIPMQLNPSVVVSFDYCILSPNKCPLTMKTSYLLIRFTGCLLTLLSSLQGPVMVLQDSTGGLIPLAKDSLGGVKEPVWLVSRENMIR